MISKYGRISDQKHHILKFKDRIVNGDSPKLRVNSSLRKPRKPQLSDLEIDKLLKSESKKPRHSISKIQKNTPSFLCQSRENYYKSTSHKSMSPPCTKYNSNYKLVFKRRASPDFSKQTIKMPKKNEEIDNRGYYDSKITQKIQGVIEFNKQLARHEREKLDDKHLDHSIPRYSNKFEKRRSLNSLSFDKQLKRKNDYFDGSPSLLSYNPRYNIVSQDLGKIFPFEKYMPRQELFKEAPQSSLKVSYTQQDKSKFSVDFSKYLPRQAKLFN